jgi:hypothetical protein
MDSKIKLMFAKDPTLAKEFADKTKKVKITITNYGYYHHGRLH